MIDLINSEFNAKTWCEWVFKTREKKNVTLIGKGVNFAKTHISEQHDEYNAKSPLSVV
jgi:hypothetical protein